MGLTLRLLAQDLSCSERTLRRGANRGLLRSRRLGPRSIELPLDEQHYVREHWTLLSQLQQGLRTERSVRLAVLFGSMATGDEGPDSDVDLLLSLDNPSPRMPLRIGRRIAYLLDQPIQVITLGQAQTNPSLFADILTEGRVLIDRDGLWTQLKQQEKQILNNAIDYERKVDRTANQAIADARRRISE